MTSFVDQPPLTYPTRNLFFILPPEKFFGFYAQSLNLFLVEIMGNDGVTQTMTLPMMFKLGKDPGGAALPWQQSKVLSGWGKAMGLSGLCRPSFNSFFCQFSCALEKVALANKTKPLSSSKKVKTYTICKQTIDKSSPTKQEHNI